MNCKKCNAELKENEKYCPFCGEKTNSSNEGKDTTGELKVEEVNSKYEEYKNNKEKLVNFNYNKYLILSILGTVFCFLPTGLISIILLETKLKQYLYNDQINEANKMKNLIVALLVAGVIISIVVSVLKVILEFQGIS